MYVRTVVNRHQYTGLGNASVGSLSPIVVKAHDLDLACSSQNS